MIKYNHTFIFIATIAGCKRGICVAEWLTTCPIHLNPPLVIVSWPQPSLVTWYYMPLQLFLRFAWINAAQRHVIKVDRVSALPWRHHFCISIRCSGEICLHMFRIFRVIIKRNWSSEYWWKVGKLIVLLWHIIKKLVVDPSVLFIWAVILVSLSLYAVKFRLLQKTLRFLLKSPLILENAWKKCWK